MKSKYLLGLLLVFLVFYIKQPQLEGLITDLQHLTGMKALAGFCALYLSANLLLLPIGLPLNLLAGLLWGTLGGGLLINVLATLVASLSFFLAKSFGHYFLNHFFEQYAPLNKLKKTINRYDSQFIFLARINPIVPFSLSNYLFGLIPELSFRRYIVATILANLVPSFAFASIGVTLKAVSLHSSNIKYLILNLGIALLLVSAMLMLKIFTNIIPNFSQETETA